MLFLLSLISEIIVFNKDNLIYKLNTVTKTAIISDHIPTEVTKFDIPSSVETPKGTFAVTQIGPNAFRDDKLLSGKLTIPSTIETIGEYGFYNTSITEISFAANSKCSLIDSHAFEFCTKLKEALIFPDSMVKLGRAAFRECILLPQAKFNTNLQVIYIQCFENCYSFAGTLTLPSGLQILEMFAFKNCYQLTAVQFGTNKNLVKYKQSFDGCPNIAVFTIHGNSIYATDSQGCFYRLNSGYFTMMNAPCAIKSFTLLSNLKYIDDNAFQYTPQLTTITVGHGNPFFIVDKNGALLRNETGPIYSLYLVPRNAVSFTAVKLLADVKPHAFRDCTKLTSFAVEAGNLDFSVVGGSLVLHNCLVAVPRDAKEYNYPPHIDSHISNPFDGCVNLAKFTVDAKNPCLHVDSKTGCVYTFLDRALLHVPPAFSGDLVLLDTVFHIDHHSFANTKNIKSLHVGNHISSVDPMEFSQYSKLPVYVPYEPSIFSTIPFLKVTVNNLSRFSIFENVKQIKPKTLYIVLSVIGGLTVMNIVIIAFIIAKRRNQNKNAEHIDTAPLIQE